jgi:hypothetical protein
LLDEILSRRTLYQAFERIRDNGGCQGADGISVGDFADRLEQELDNLQDRLLRRIYHPYPPPRRASRRNKVRIGCEGHQIGDCSNKTKPASVIQDEAMLPDRAESSVVR